MKKFIALISGVSLAVLVGSVSLADEKPKEEEAETSLKDCKQCKLKKSYPNLEIKTDGDEDEAQSPDLTHVRTVNEGDTLPKTDVNEDDEASKMKGDFSRGHAPRNKTEEKKEDEDEDKDEDG